MGFEIRTRIESQKKKPNYVIRFHLSRHNNLKTWMKLSSIILSQVFLVLIGSQHPNLPMIIHLAQTMYQSEPNKTFKQQWFKTLRQKRWRLYDGNKNFAVCKSYPQYLVVPESIKDDAIMKASKFRDDSRFPVLSCVGKNFIL